MYSDNDFIGFGVFQEIELNVPPHIIEQERKVKRRERIKNNRSKGKGRMHPKFEGD